MGYSIPASIAKTSMVIKGSIFLTEIRKITSNEEMRAFYKELKELHPKAVHCCWAMIFDAPTNSNSYGFSDDGEPSGTAGKPMFNVISHKNIGQIGVIVTRYFGGIKLGTGGLVKAYTEAVQNAIEVLEVSDFYNLKTITITINYNDEPSIRHFFNAYKTISAIYEYGVDIKVNIEISDIEYIEFKQNFEKKFVFITIIEL